MFIVVGDPDSNPDELPHTPSNVRVYQFRQPPGCAG